MSTVNNYRGPNIVKDGLILYLDVATNNSYNRYFSTTSLKDISSNNYIGTLTNSPVYSSSNNGILIFDGINESYNISSQISDVMNTIDIWINMKSTSPCPILYYGSDTFDSNVWTWGMAIFPTSTHGFNEGPLNYPTTSLYTDTVDLNVWKNFTLVRNDSGNVKLYKNGVLVGTKTGSGTVALRNAADRLYIGKAGSTYGNFSIGSIKIYNKALTATEILQNYNVTKSRFGL
jgi:hypothetical protein